MERSTVGLVVLILGLSAMALSLFHALGGELSTGAWAGVLIALGAGVGGAAHQRRRRSPFRRVRS